jgi:hypothetical protein
MSHNSKLPTILNTMSISMGGVVTVDVIDLNINGVEIRRMINILKN